MGVRALAYMRVTTLGYSSPEAAAWKRRQLQAIIEQRSPSAAARRQIASAGSETFSTHKAATHIKLLGSAGFSLLA